MANIIQFLTKQEESGNLYIDCKGNLVKLDFIEKNAKKSYLIDLKQGVVSFEKSFNDYLSEIKEMYIPINGLVETIKATIKFVPEVPEMPEPVQENENLETEETKPKKEKVAK